MQAQDILGAVQERAGTTKAEIAQRVGVHPVVVGKAFSAGRVGLGVAARYLQAMGYRVWVAPESLHLGALSDDIIAVDADAPAKD